MSWIIAERQKWRALILVGIIISFFGPWAYDRINVPAEYTCSPPNIRLYGDFCGIPILGIQGFIWIIGGLISISGSVITGEFNFPDRMREILYSLLMLFPLLPLVSLIALRRSREQQPRKIFTIIAWILAIGACLFLGLNNPVPFWFVWGIWLFIGLAASALVLEIVNRNHNRQR